MKTKNYFLRIGLIVGLLALVTAFGIYALRNTNSNNQLRGGLQDLVPVTFDIRAVNKQGGNMQDVKVAYGNSLPLTQADQHDLPYSFGRKSGDVQTQNFIRFGSKDGFNPPTTLAMANEQSTEETVVISGNVISNIPTDVKVYRNNLQTPYQKGQTFLAGDTIIIVGTYQPSLPASIDDFNYQQIKDDSGKVEFKIDISDPNTETLMKMGIDYEIDGDGQCDGPWLVAPEMEHSFAALSGPVSVSQGSFEFQPDKQVLMNQENSYQISDLSNNLNPKNQVTVTWLSKQDAPNATFNKPECIQVRLFDWPDHVTSKTFLLNINNTGDNAFDIDVRTENEEGQSVIKRVDYSNDNAGFLVTPKTFSNQSLVGNKSITFEDVLSLTTPGTVTIQGDKINAPLPSNVKLYKNQVGVNYSAGSTLTENDKLIVVGVYKNADLPPVNQGDENVNIEIYTRDENGESDDNYSYNGAPYLPTPSFLDRHLDDFGEGTLAKTITFEPREGYVNPEELTIVNRVPDYPEGVDVYLNQLGNPYPANYAFTEDDTLIVVGNYIVGNNAANNAVTLNVRSQGFDGAEWQEGYSYNGEPYVNTPDTFEKQITDFGTGTLKKTIAFEPREGFVTPGTLTIDNRKINSLPKNVKVYLNNENNAYPLGTELQSGDELFVIGKYIYAAEIVVNMEGPNGFPGGEVKVGQESKFIDNEEQETFMVDPDGSYQVLCPQVSGYKLLTSPNPVNVNNLESGQDTQVTCEYSSEADNNTTTITVGMDGPNGFPGGVVKIPGVTNGTDIDDGDEETFTVEPNKSYQVYCPSVKGYLLTTKPNPITINPLSQGQDVETTCKYIKDTGAEEYDPDKDYDFFGNEESCLSYEDRDLLFRDLQPNQLGYAAAEVLKNTYSTTKVTTEEIEDAVRNYALSGFGSNVTGNNQDEAEVRLPAEATRMQVTLLTMELHCLPIFRGSSLPNTRLDGKPMPKVYDMPEEGTVAYDVIKTAFFYGILEGYRYQMPNNYVLWDAPITNWQFIKVVNNAGQNWQGYQNISDFNLARQYGFDQSDWVYTFVARALREGYPDSPILETPSLLRTTERNISRGEMVQHLLMSIFERHIYYPEDEEEAKDAYEELTD